MIQFYYKGKKVCSMPVKGLTVTQMLAGRKLLAQKLKVNDRCIEFNHIEEGV